MTTQTQPEATKTSLQLVRAQVNTPNLHIWMAERKLVDRDHAMHCLLTESFGEKAPRPFYLASPTEEEHQILYGYTKDANASELRLQAAMGADPLQTAVIPPDTILSKEMPTTWPTGTRLGFQTRVRPINKPKGLYPDRKNRPEIDRYTLKIMLGNMPGNQPYSGTRLDAYTEWLQYQFDRYQGAVLHTDETMLTSFSITSPDRGSKQGRPKGPDVTIRGALTITNSDNFTKMLAQGVGRHRAYGYGMLLLNPYG